MDLADFTGITVKVVASDGIDEYLPTLMLPDSREVQAIQGIPEDVDDREAIQNVIRRQGQENREFFFGVRSGETRVVTGHVRPGHEPDFMEIDCAEEAYPVKPVARPDWWTL